MTITYSLFTVCEMLCLALLSAFTYLIFIDECCYPYFLDKESESLERLYKLIQIGFFFILDLKCSKMRTFFFLHLVQMVMGEHSF